MKYWLLLAAFSMLTSCAVTLAPHTPYIPAIRSEGEAEAKFSSSLTGKQLELQLGYQLNDRVVIHAAALAFNRRSLGTSFGSADLGLGYYRTLADARWRLGVHAGLAYGQGNSGSDFCFDCNDPSAVYKVGYTYAYVQPTALLLFGRQSTGVGLRLGQAYFHRLDGMRTQLTPDGISTEFFSRDGHMITFLQPTVQHNWQLWSWLEISSSLGIQAPLNKRSALDLLDPFTAQASLHVILGRRPVVSP